MKDLLVEGVILFISSFMQLYIFSLMISLVLKTNFSRTQKILFAFSQSLPVVIVKVFCPESVSLSLYLPICSIALSIFASKIILKLTITKSIIATFAFAALSSPVELVSGLIAFKIFHISTNTKSIIETIPILIIINLWFILFYLILYVACNKKKSWELYLPFLKNKYNYINLFALILFIIPNIYFYNLNQYNYPIYLLIYNIVSILFLAILSMYNTYKGLQYDYKKMELENAELHNKTLNTLIDNIRVFKHDYNNVVHAIGGYILLNDMEGLKKYYNGLAKDSKKVNQLEAISPTKINEPSIYGLIASKYQIADLKHLSFNFESVFDYQNLNMPIYDFCKVFGILLDNAIEAAEETEEKIINVYVRESVKDHIQLFSIENSYANKEIDTERIFEKDYSTKHRNSGIGLWEVKNIIEKNKHVTLITSKDEKFFKQELYIQTNDKEN